MSGIFGLTRFDGGPIAREDLDRMCASMAHWGPGNVGCWRDGAAGFGRCLMPETPETVYERPPSFAGERPFAFVGEARLDNRDELFEALGVAHPERPTTADGLHRIEKRSRQGNGATRMTV